MQDPPRIWITHADIHYHATGICHGVAVCDIILCCAILFYNYYESQKYLFLQCDSVSLYDEFELEKKNSMTIDF